MARDKTRNYLDVVRARGIVTERHTRRKNSITPVSRAGSMKYSSCRFYGNNKNADLAGFSLKTFISVDLEEKEKASNGSGQEEGRKERKDGGVAELLERGKYESTVFPSRAWLVEIKANLMK